MEYIDQIGCDDDYNAVDVSVYGSSEDMPAQSWPSEQDISSEAVLAGVEILRNARLKREADLGL